MASKYEILQGLRQQEAQARQATEEAIVRTTKLMVAQAEEAHARGEGKMRWLDVEEFLGDPKFDRRFRVYNSGLNSYDYEFKNVCPQGIRGLIGNNSSFTMIDLMSSSTATNEAMAYVKSQAEKNRIEFNGLGVAVSMDDLRNPEVREADAELNVSQIAADISERQTWNKIQAALGGRKANLIVERGQDGFKYIPISALFLQRSLGRMWRMLEPDGGTMLLQVHYTGFAHQAGVDLGKWAGWLKQQGIEGALGGPNTIDSTFSALKIVRNPKSPENFPIPQDLSEIS